MGYEFHIGTIYLRPGHVKVGLAVIPGSLAAQPVIWRNPLIVGDIACEMLAASFADALTKMNDRLLPRQIIP
jgi:hypothetical protein